MSESPGFGVGFEPGGWGVHGGIERFSKPRLEAYRHAVVDASLGPELEAALAPLRKGRRYEIGGRTYARVPRGFDANMYSRPIMGGIGTRLTSRHSGCSLSAGSRRIFFGNA